MGEPPEKSVELSIRNDITELVAVSEALQRIGENADIPSKTLMHLQIVLDEILSNIIKYAWNPSEPHEIKIGIKVHNGTVTLAFVDDGTPFDPSGHSLVQPETVGTRPQPGGKGIHLVKQLVDEFQYASIDGKNRLTITKRYHSTGGGR
jgi:anti-sigma regulatory factor (Ser/Thr protein kinase)